MLNAIDLFAGIGGLRTIFHDSYSTLINESALNRLMEESFDELDAYSLKNNIHPRQEEYHLAQHLADLDILEQFCSIFVRNHRNYKYCRGRADTAAHVLQILSNYGIFISAGKYNNWRRKRNYRLIDDESLELLLELLRVTPSEFKRLVYAHILARREMEKEHDSSDIGIAESLHSYLKDSLFLRIKLSRPPCLCAVYPVFFQIHPRFLQIS